MLGIPYPLGEEPRPVGVFTPVIPNTGMRFMAGVQGEYKASEPPSPDDDPSGGTPAAGSGQQMQREPKDYQPYVPFQLKLVA